MNILIGLAIVTAIGLVLGVPLLLLVDRLRGNASKGKASRRRGSGGNRQYVEDHSYDHDYVMARAGFYPASGLYSSDE